LGRGNVEDRTGSPCDAVAVAQARVTVWLELRGRRSRDFSRRGAQNTRDPQPQVRCQEVVREPHACDYYRLPVSLHEEGLGRSVSREKWEGGVENNRPALAEGGVQVPVAVAACKDDLGAQVRLRAE